MSARPRASEFLGRRLSSNVRTKAAMLGVAFLIWLFVRLDQETTIVVPMPVQVDLSALPGKVLLYPPPEKVSVTLKGRGRSLLGYVLFHHGRYIVRPQDVNEHTHSTEVTNLDLNGRPEVAVLTISPALFTLELDNEHTRTVPITLRARVEAAEGFLLASPPVIQPREVEVRGPGKLLDTLSTIYTDAGDLTRLRKDLKVTLPLSLPFREAQLQTSNVVLSAIVDHVVEQRVDNIPLRLLHNPEGLVPSAASLSVVVQGAERTLEQLRPGEIIAVLDLSLRESPEARVPCQVWVPDGVELRQTLPERFQVHKPGHGPRSVPADSLGGAARNTEP